MNEYSLAKVQLFYIVIILSDIVGHVIYENNLNGILDKYIQLL